MYRGKTNRVRVDNVAELKQIDAFIKKLAPDQLTAVEVDKSQFIEAYKESADIIEVAEYTSSYAEQLIPRLVDDLEKVQRLVGARKPFLFWIGSSIPNPSYRTAEEIRCATYLALMHGADGIVYHMGHGGIPPTYTRHWSVYPGLAREVETVFPILVAPQPDGTPPIDAAPTEIVACVRQRGRQLYLIAVNTSPYLVKAEFRIKDRSFVAERARLPLENREIAFDGGRFSDEFTRFETHVYEINPTSFE